MKSLIARLPLPKGVGLYLGEDEIAISQVAATGWGYAETARHREPCGPHERKEALQAALRSVLGRRVHPRTPIAVGLPSTQFFFASRPLRELGGDDTGKGDRAGLGKAG